MAIEHPILIVDDDEAIVDFVQMALESEGYQVVTAFNGTLALELLTTITPALILLDMRMPEMNGWQFVEAYRRTAARLAPVVVMTAGKSTSETAAEVEAAAYIGKPFDIEDLLRTVESFARDPSD